MLCVALLKEDFSFRFHGADVSASEVVRCDFMTCFISTYSGEDTKSFRESSYFALKSDLFIHAYPV